MGPRAARAWHAVTALVAAFALVFQLILVIAGAQVLGETGVPPMSTRLIRFISYFTVLSNLLVCVISATLAFGGDRDTRWWRVLRLDALVGIAVTGVVSWVILWPLLHLTGAPWVADKLLHLVVPILAMLGWVLVGPRRRIRATDLLWALIYPLAWLAYTLIRGAIVHWYPYPFVNVDALGLGRVMINCAAVAVLFIALFAAAYGADRALSRRRTSPA